MMLLSVLALPMLAQDKVVLKDDVIKVYIDVDNDFYFCQLLFLIFQNLRCLFLP